MSIKIQLNSIEALERLIGGDNKIELEIRNNIVQEFTKRRLKSLVNHEFEKNVVKKAFAQLLDGVYSWGIKMTDSQKNTVKELVRNVASEAVKTEATEFFATYKNEIKKIVKTLLPRFIQGEISVQIREIIKDKLTEQIESHMSESIKENIDSLFKGDKK